MAKGYTKHGPPTMARVWHLFSQEDRAILRFQLVQNLPEHANLHAGLLPFVTLEDCIAALDISLLGADSRRVTKIQRKLEAIAFDNRDKVLLKLSDAQVTKRFGTKPHLGKPFPWLPPRAVKMQALGDHPMVSVEGSHTTVTPCVALVPHGNQMWEVRCEEQYRQRIETWLIDHVR